MKITFSNLGSIKKTTLDLRPLTVIIGPNNSNKTYIAYSIYGLWESIFQQPSPLFFDEELVHNFGNTFFLQITNEFIDSFIKNCGGKFKEFEADLETFFQDSSSQLFKLTNYKVSISREEVKKAIQTLSGEKIRVFYNSFEFKVKNNTLYGKAIKDDKEEDSIEASESEFAFSLMYIIRNALFARVFSLPAERNAFIITYKFLENRRYKLLKKADRNLNRNLPQIKLPSKLYGGEVLELANVHYPQPIEDFLDFLTDIELQPSAIEDSEERLKFHELANKIEINIQGNNRTQFKSTKFGGKEIKINVKKGLDIDLYNASSSIKQLAPLLLYLRYRAQENDLLIIDEPEMNLHPESQAKLLEVLGMLVNAGVNVLLTTHSPYFMSHLNNLVSGKTDDEKVLKEQAKSLYLGDERAFLKMEDVSAYEMKNNKLKDLKDKDYGIRWDTLSDVSADIQQKFFEIYEKGDTPTDGEEE